MVQEYENSSAAPYETSFFFPIDIDFALSHIKIEFESFDQPGKITTVETVIEERKKAEQKYEDSVATGKEMPILAQTVSRKARNLMRV